MSLGAASIEWFLLNGGISDVTGENLSVELKTLVDFTSAVKCGDFFKTTEVAEVLRFLSSASEGKNIQGRVASGMRAYLSGSTTLKSTHDRQACLLLLGICSLHSFLQACWTGPDLGLSHDAVLSVLNTNSQGLQTYLKVDGEDPYHLTTNLGFLVLARSILVDNADLLADLKSVPWWSRRAILVHQLLLDNPSATLMSLLEPLGGKALATLDTLSGLTETWVSEIHAKFWLEQGFVHHYYKQNKRAKECFSKAQEATQLQWELSGALGKRTKFQTFDVSQLVLLAKSSLDSAEVKGSIPDTLALNDDTLLEKIELTDKNEKLDAETQGKLRSIDQCVLLAYSLNIKNTNPDHGLTTEEMFPYVSRVLENPNNWMIHSMALLLRSRLEARKSRTVERSVLQIQALVDQWNDETAAAKERLAYIFSIFFPSKWELE
ncbi:hypothetical protein HDU76_002574, partial [Blyttiomyces sp. JEL0837]